MNARRLAELEAALQDPSVAAVADVHSAVRAAVNAGLELLAEVKQLAYERRLLADCLRATGSMPAELATEGDPQ